MSTKSVPIKLTDGKERELRFDWKTLCRFEREFGFSVIEVGKRLGMGTINLVDATNIIWAGLLHEEKQMSLREVEELLTIDDLLIYLKVIGEAITQAIPSEEKPGKNV